MRNVDKVSFPYRASTHLNLLHVIAELGSWAKHGLDVNYDYQITKDGRASRGQQAARSSSSAATTSRPMRTARAATSGSISARRSTRSIRSSWCGRIPASTASRTCAARGSVPAACIPASTTGCCSSSAASTSTATTSNSSTRSTASSSAEAAEQLEGADAEAERRKKRTPVWQWVRDGHVDAALLDGAVASVRRRRRPQGDRHRAAADDLVHHHLVEPAVRREASRHRRALPQGHDRRHPFLQDAAREEHRDHPSRRYTKEGQLNRAQATWIYQTPGAHAGAQALSRPWRRSRTSTKRPSARTRTPRRSIRWSYGTCTTSAASTTAASSMRSTRNGRKDPHAKDRKDPEFRREQERKQAEVIAAVKACGHLEGENCGCELSEQPPTMRRIGMKRLASHC